MGAYNIQIIPSSKFVWAREDLLSHLHSSELQSHPEYTDDFLLACDIGVVFIRPDEDGKYGHTVNIRVSSTTDPDEYMSVVRSLAARLKGQPVFEQDPGLRGFEPLTHHEGVKLRWDFQKSIGIGPWEDQGLRVNASLPFTTTEPALRAGGTWAGWA